MGLAETARLVARLDLEGNFQAKLRGAAGALSNFDRRFSNTSRALGRTAHNLSRLGILVAGAAVAGTGLVIRAAADYESAFAGVRKTVSATEEELQALSDQFRAMSKEIPITASELARLGEAGGALGVPTDQLKEFVRVTALLGVTTNLTADEAANSLGILGNVLHLTGAEYSQFASALVALGNAGASTEADIVAIAERAGAAGALVGVTTQQILGFASATASLGIEVEAGGTSIQKFFIETAKAIAKAGGELPVFAKTAGMSAKEFKQAFEKDAGGTLQKFLAGLGKLSQPKQLAVLDDLKFTDTRITRLLLGLANNTALVSDQMGVANKAFAENTALTKEAEQRFNTFDSQLQLTKNHLSDMAITIGSKLLPKLTPLLKRLNEFINANQGNIEAFGTRLAEGIDKAVMALGSVNWAPFIDGLRVSAEIAQTIFAGFRALPGDVQAALIGVAAVNKVTGGLITGIAKDLGKILLQQFAGRGSSPANPLWVQSVAGGVGGMGKGAGGFLGKVAILGAVALAGATILELKGLLDNQSAANAEASADLATKTRAFLASPTTKLSDLKGSLAGIEAYREELLNGAKMFTAEGIAFALNVDHIGETVDAQIAALKTEIAAQTPTSGDPRVNPVPGSAGASVTLSGWRAFVDDQRDVARRLWQTPGGDKVGLTRALVAGFSASTSPSLTSMQAHLAKIRELQASGDPKTRAALGGSIASLQALIDRRLTELALAVSALAGFTTGNAGWTGQRSEEIGRPAVVVVPPTARDNYASGSNARRYTPMPARAL